MSTNEETHATGPDAAAPTSGEAAAPAPSAPPPAAPATPTPGPSDSASAGASTSTRSQSRFYSRMGRSATTGGPAKPAATSISSEGLTPDEAANLNLKDNLPVRATMGSIPEFAPGEGRGDGPRGDRGERRDRDDRGDRGERGDRFDRGDRRERRGRGERGDRFERGDRGERGERYDRGPRHEHGHATQPHAGTPGEPTAGISESSAPVEPSEAAPAAAPAPASPPPPEAPRRVRFEDAAPESHQRSVQEFRPSRDRSWSEGGEKRPRPEKSEPPARSPGLLGWMKSIFSGGGESGGAEKPSESQAPGRPDRGDRGSRGRPQHQGGPREGGHGEHGGGEHGGGGEGPGGRRRRRRRRGGRGRHHDGGGGERGPGGAAG